MSEMSWQPQSLRLTAFLSPSAQPEDSDWWARLVGEPPEVHLSKPRTGGFQEEGPIGEGRLGLTVEASRIDWVWAAPEEPQPGFAFLGTLNEAIKSFSGLMHKWMNGDDCPELQRLAFGALLLQPVTNREEGYARMSEYLPFALDESSSDFSYQINRARASSVIDDLAINRLTRWSVLAIRGFSLTMGADHIGYSQSDSILTACRLELDVNTAPSFEDVLPEKRLPNVYDELVKLSLEIAKEGDTQ